MSSHVTSNLAYSFCYAKRFLWLSLATLKPSSRCQPKNKPYYAPQSSTRKKPILIDYTHQLIHHQGAPFHAWKHDENAWPYLSLSLSRIMAWWHVIIRFIRMSYCRTNFFLSLSLLQICQQFLAAMIQWQINIDDGTLIVIFTFLFISITQRNSFTSEWIDFYPLLEMGRILFFLSFK